MRESYRVAAQNLRANRTRTLLTTLGIVIGVASITLVLALGEGVRQAVSGQVKRLDGNVIIIKPGNEQDLASASYNPYTTAITTTLTERDYNTVKKTDNVRDVAPVMMLSGTIRTDTGETVTAPILATTESLPRTLGLSIRSGQFIDSGTSRDTVVIGQQLAINLFGTDQARGQSLMVKGRPHTVIGVVKNTRTPINLSGIDLDHAAYVSLDDGKSFNQGIAQIQQLIVQTDDRSKLEDTVAKLDSALLKNHTGEQDYAVLYGEGIAAYSGSFFGSLIFVTAIVSIITLIVSGIGVMNIMLVGVTERTREIGIRKALGATNRNIMGQFLIEALIICITGGIIGIALAYALAFFIASQLSFQPSLSPFISLIGFGLALGVGVVFGLYPAIKAAKKDPIVALRQYQ